MTKTKQVFISHATKDTQFAHRLADDLQRLGVPVWIAPESIRPGEGWVRAIERGLKESSHVVVVLTQEALESKWVEKETDVAIAQERKGRIQIIPLDVEPCRVPLLLSSYQMVSFRRGYGAGLSQLADILDVSVTVPEVARPTVMERRQPLEPEMILIPAGEFLMGSGPSGIDTSAWDPEVPEHIMYLPDYYLAKAPVTNAQYGAFVRARGHKQPKHWKGGKPPEGKVNHPVVYVSWYDAVAYCRWLSKLTGKPYHLPSEAEWEKGARGSDGCIYPWGNQWDAKRCNSQEGGSRDTTPVDNYPQGASAYGLLDMAGNVWEWTRSLWGWKGEMGGPSFRYPYDPADGREDLHAPGGVRVARGGAFDIDGKHARCAHRNWFSPRDRWGNLGFRAVVAPSSPRL